MAVFLQMPQLDTVKKFHCISTGSNEPLIKFTSVVVAQPDVEVKRNAVTLDWTLGLPEIHSATNSDAQIHEIGGRDRELQ